MPKYPTHEEIADRIMKLVEANLNCPFAHHRETLDDIISDLRHYRDTIPTVEEYIFKNLL